MAIEIGPVSAIVVLAVITYLTRIGGIVITSFMPITPRMEAVLEALAGAVLISIVMPIAVEGDYTVKSAVAVSIAVMIWRRQPALAMGAGIVTAIVLRATV